ncbi:MAG TPA: hypothetical protein VE549_03710 [Myxococcaceae bacterium]|jgi:hypothetical protein|nr:hypothetical protein [Myxococcaceae bacterium]
MHEFYVHRVGGGRPCTSNPFSVLTRHRERDAVPRMSIAVWQGHHAARDLFGHHLGHLHLAHA